MGLHTHTQELCLDVLEPNLNTGYVGWGAQQVSLSSVVFVSQAEQMRSLTAHLSIVPLQEDLFYTGMQNRKEMQLRSQATLFVFSSFTIT